GTFQDWTVAGEAFGEKPVEGDVVLARTGDTQSRHEGTFWGSSGEVAGHRATGTMTSVAFTVTQPYASFLVSGGALKDTRVELVQAENNTVYFETSGYDHATSRPVVVDLRPIQGKEIYLRLIDNETGMSDIPYIRDNKWAYIGFDDFKFYASRPAFPNEFDPSEIFIMPSINPVLHAGLSAQDAAEAMTVPEGFTVTLAASEPDVIRPIAFTHDDRGRLWVVEAHTYPVPAPEGQGRDRILIFEDTNGDGTLDSRKVFIEGLNLVSGIEVGFGGVWAGAAPYLLYIPIEAGADRPAGPPEIMLDGWGTQDTHEILNSLRWGPDGWLYGTHGVFTHSLVGTPGTPEAERTPLNGGVWRFHPTRHTFERFAEGTSNPWGLDFNDYGHPFITACVIPHLYYVIDGARYQRQAGEHFNPYIFDDIKTHGDHVHWVGERGPHAGNHRSGQAGGGHAHAGAMVYLGGSWPDEYRNQLFMNNIHGYRTNMDILERAGSGYVGRHGADFLFANDSWSQMLNFRYGPDGSVHVIDWYDKNQCHSPNPDIHDKTLGRIFKISYKDDAWVQVDLQQMSSTELVALQLHENDWYVRHARRLLQERGPDAQVHANLKRILQENPDITRRLRALWALHVTEGLSDQDLIALLHDEHETVRSWAIQLLAEDRTIPEEALDQFAVMAREDVSAQVRLYLASALQRTPPAERWEVLAGLSDHAEDADDHNLPLMVWYAAEPMADVDMDRMLGMALAAKLPNLLPYTVQRIAAMGTPEALRILSQHLGMVEDPTQQRELLKGLNQLVGGTE
ncbi:MAG: PVC-type heme-binding CxxCH protein, partial [Rhodothermales bacterium]